MKAKVLFPLIFLVSILLTTILSNGCSDEKEINRSKELTVNQYKEASQNQFDIRTTDVLDEKNARGNISHTPIERAAKILQDEKPPISDIKWIESLADTQLEKVFQWMEENIKVDSSRVKILQSYVVGDSAKSSCWGNWQYEWIELQNGSGTGCYSDGFTNDWDHRCGNDWPPDKVYFFPCTNYNNKWSIRIWSTDWRSRLAIGSGASARVYQGCVQICVGYWHLYFSFANPYTLMRSTYIYW